MLTLSMDSASNQAGTSAEPEASLATRSWWWQGLLLAFLLVFLYHRILVRLVENWWGDPNFSHGFLVPFFSGYLIWRDRKRLAAVTLKPSWFGLAVIAGALAILVVGVLGSELFLSRSSLLFLLAGLVIYFGGWRLFRALIFPWAFLFLMIPIPAIVFNQIAFPLQLLASRFAGRLLELVGIPVLQQGNIIQLASIPLEVAEACSGIRSLMSLGALAILYGYFLEPKIGWRIVLAVAAIPIAVVSNGLRVVGTGLLVEWWDPERALGFFHTFSGWVIFMLALGLLIAFHGALRFIDGWLVTRKQ
jgi:exosortase